MAEPVDTKLVVGRLALPAANDEAAALRVAWVAAVDGSTKTVVPSTDVPAPGATVLSDDEEKTGVGAGAEKSVAGSELGDADVAPASATPVGDEASTDTESTLKGSHVPVGDHAGADAVGAGPPQLAGCSVGSGGSTSEREALLREEGLESYEVVQWRAWTWA